MFSRFGFQVDFKAALGLILEAKNAKKGSPFWNPNSIFSVSISLHIFNVFRYRVLMKMLVDFGSMLDASWGTLSNYVHYHMSNLNFIGF